MQAPQSFHLQAVCGLSLLGHMDTCPLPQMWELGVLLAGNLSHTQKGFHSTLGLHHQELTLKLLVIKIGDTEHM